MAGLAVLLLLLFSILGLGLMTSNRIYMMLISHRRKALFLGLAAENGIKLGLHKLVDRAAPLVPITGEELAAIRADAEAGGTLACFFLFGGADELAVEEDWRNLSWCCRPLFHLEELEELDGFFRGDYALRLDAEGLMEAYPVRRREALRLRLGILAGRIPLSTIPLLLETPETAEEKEKLTRSIVLSPDGSSLNKPEPIFTDKSLLPKSITPQLASALKINIKMFSPLKLSRAQIRQALGLEISSDPIPEGVYLIEDDLGLGGVYIQGDLSRLTLAVDHDVQMLEFTTEAGRWLLQYSPQKSTTVFRTPEETRHYNLIPKGMIISTGDILSLNAGLVDPSGESLHPIKEKIPCLMSGLSLTIVSPKTITLSSHLIQQGVEWAEGFPYIKGKPSRLHIYAAGRDAQGREEKEWGGIHFSAEDMEEVEIHASLTAGGSGISFIEGNANLLILGCLHSSSLSPAGKILLFPGTSHLTTPEGWPGQLLTAHPVLYIASLDPLSWEDG
jgi:hypothetical protein